MKNFEPVFTAKNDQAVLNIYRDYCAESPRVSSDPKVVNFYIHPKCSIQIDPLEPQVNVLKFFAHRLLIPHPENLRHYDLLNAVIEKDMEGKFIYAQPLYMDKNKSPSLNTAPFDECWDTGKIGYLFVTRFDFDRICQKWDKSYLEKEIQAELKEMNHYLSNECYRFVLEELHTCDACPEIHTREIVSSSGFVGDLNDYRNLIAKEVGTDYPELHAQLLKFD